MAEKLTSKTGLDRVIHFLNVTERMQILICRLCPFVSFDIVSYAAESLPMSFVSFFVATGVGRLPCPTIVYSYVGGMLTGGQTSCNSSIDFVCYFGIPVFMLRKIYMDRQSENKNREEKNMVYYNPEDLAKFRTIGKSIRLAEKFFAYYNAVFEEVR